MEGYSVTEAASVLGVPTERVWELLARGVLAGTPEGDTGMRVFLQPRPAPAPSPMEMPPPSPTPREPERELSPFRELLTEFRNLTERYGQALLALGEARGEVAALRSRVDLLEARMDLRLPAAADPAPAAWGRAASAPPPMRSIDPAPVREDASDAGTADVADAAAAESAHDRQARRRRSAHRWSTEDFAEALARAEDPTAPELPRPEPVAAHGEPIRVAESEAPAAAATDEPSPEPVAATTEAPSGEVSTGAEIDEIALPGELPAAEPMPSADAPDEPDAPVGDVLPDPEPVTIAEEPSPSPGPTVDPADVAATAAEPSEPAAPLEWDPGRYTTEIGEPDWYAEDEPVVTSLSAEREAPTDDAVPEVDVPAGAGTGPGQDADGLEARAAERFEQALAALDALSRSSPRVAAPASSVEAPAEAAPAPRPARPMPTPASRAYRRLRRIFPE